MSLSLDITEPQLTAITEHLPVGVLIHYNSTILFANPALLAMVGCKNQGEVIGSSPIDFIHPDDRWIVRTRLRNSDDRGFNPPLEERLVRRDGSIVHARVSGFPLVFRGHPASMAVFSDLSQSKASDLEAKENGARFKALFESEMAGQLIVDDEGCVLTANEFAAQMLGLDAGGLKGSLMRDCFEHPGDFDDVWERARRKGALHEEHRLRRAIGDSFPAVLSVRARLLPGQNFVALQSRAGEEQRQENQRQAQKMEAIGQLAGGVAHDFNNILMAISMNCQNLMRQLAGQEGPMAQLGELLASCEKAGSVTRQLLAFSRAEEAKPSLLDLNQHVNTARNLISRLLPEDIELELRLEAESGWVRAEPTQVDQILLNLGVNARDAMPSGGPLAIRTRNAELPAGTVAARLGLAAGPYAVLSVRDAGVGMSEPVRRRIFEPFFTTKGPGKGTGLGLSAVYGIVQGFGGAIDVESQPGQGSLFEIYLPLAQAPEGAAAMADPVGFAAAGEGGAGEKVMLVEDEAALRKALGWALRDKGYQVVEAENAAQALELAAGMAKLPDAVITDLVMPGMSGLQLAAQLRQRFALAKVLFMSGHAHPALTGESPGFPAENFLQKPARLELILGRLRAMLDGPDDPGHGESRAQV